MEKVKKYGIEIIDQIWKRLDSEKKGIIIAGDNSSGKTTIIKELIENKKNDKSIYYIKPENRVISTGQNDNKRIISNCDVKDIVDSRMENDIDKIIHGQHQGNNVSDLVYQELMEHCKQEEENLLEDINKLFKLQISVASVERMSDLTDYDEEILNVNGLKISEISSSEMSKIRIMTEIWYAKEKGCKIIFIDELDSSFDRNNTVSFIKKISEYYEDIKFVIGMHNVEFLLEIDDFYLALFNNNKSVKLCDLGEVTELSQIQKYLYRKDNNISDSEDKLRDYITRLHEGTTEPEAGQFDYGKYRDASVKSKIMCEYIDRIIKEK